MKLYSDQLREDPRIIQAKQLVLEAMDEYSRKLTHIQSPKQELEQSYQDMLKHFSTLRGAPLFFPYVGSGLGNGSFVELLDGSIKYDMITGIGVHFLGHSSPEFAEAAFLAALSDTIMQGNLQQNKESYEIMKIFSETAKIPHCFLTTSGVMANENALKIALQKNAPADRILCFEHCFAGRTTTFSQVTDKPSFRENLPLNIQVDYIPFYDKSKPEESTKSAIEALKKVIERYPKKHAIMIFELIQGEAGFYVGSKPFFEALMQICKAHHIAVFSDEIQTFGRTPALYAFQYFQLEKYIDILAIGKLSQICATLFTDEYCPKPGLLSQTFTGSTSSLFASLALMKKLLNGNYYGPNGRIQKIHERFELHLKGLEKECPDLIRGPYGIGGMIAFTPLSGKWEEAVAFVHALFKAGVLSFIAGSHPTRVRFLVPALAITDDDIDQVMKIVKNTLKNLHVLS